MEKVLRRVALAKAHAQRRAKQLDMLELKQDRRMNRQQKSSRKVEENTMIKTALKHQRETWKRGPLAPDYRALNPEVYGTRSILSSHLPTVPKPDRIKDWFIREGDRVCVVEGGERIKGRIGEVVGISEEEESVRVQDVNVFDGSLPVSHRSLNADNVMATEFSVPLRDVRLVYPLPDPQTGVPRDCILTNLVKKDAFFNPYKDKEEWTRVLMPQDIRIPWPVLEDGEPVKETRAGDTVRIDVEHESFLPTLLRPPMPGSVIDEVRNRTSKLRDRHDEDYVARKMAEDEEARKQQELLTLLQPVGARNIARGPRRRQQGPTPTPTPTLDSANGEEGAGIIYNEIQTGELEAAESSHVDFDEERMEFDASITDELEEVGEEEMETNTLMPQLNDDLLAKIGAHMARNGLELGPGGSLQGRFAAQQRPTGATRRVAAITSSSPTPAPPAPTLP